MREGLKTACALLFLWAAAPPTEAQEEPHPPPAPFAENPAPAPTGFAPYDAFRDWKRALPFKLNANLWLYWWQPLSRTTTLAGGSLDGTLEIWAFRLEVEKFWQQGGFHIETRFRDGGRIPGGTGGGFGASAQSNVWLQEAFGSLTPDPRFNLRVGKMYQKMGLYWDDTFFGNLLYYDGIMLNPDWGVTAEGKFDFAGGKASLEYWVQYFLTSDGVQGSYTYARTLTVDPTNATSYRTANPDAEAEAGTTVANTALGRLLLTSHQEDAWVMALGATAATGVVNRNNATLGINDQNARYSRLETDLSITKGAFGLFVEYLHQSGPGMRPADYVIGGIHGGYNRFSAHVDASWVRYALDPDIEEFMLVPGIGINVTDGLNLYLDYDEWRRHDPRLATNYTPYDRSILLAVDYYY